jgi:hypothetical protein
MKFWIVAVVIVALVLVGGVYLFFTSQRLSCTVILSATGNLSDSSTSCTLQHCVFDLPSSSPTSGVRLVDDGQVIGEAALTGNTAILKGPCRQPIKDRYVIEVFDASGTTASVEYWMGGS